MINHITPEKLAEYQKILDKAATNQAEATEAIKTLNRSARGDLWQFVDYSELNSLVEIGSCKFVKKEIFKLL